MRTDPRASWKVVAWAISATILMTVLMSTGTRLARADEPAARRWWHEASPVVVLIVADGLRGDALEADAPWDGPLMPELQERAATCLRWPDVWTELVDREASYRQLLSGCSPAAALQGEESMQRGFTTLPAIDGAAPAQPARDVDAIVEALDRASSATRGVLVVARLRGLTFPLDLRPKTLQALDPSPWAGAPSAPIEVEWIAQKRLRQAMEMARSASPLQAHLNESSREIYRWVVDAAHRELDSQLGRIFERLSRDDLSARATWILTSTGGTAYDRHGLEGFGHGAMVDALHVPMWWHFPEAVEFAGSRPGAYVLRDLPAAVSAWSKESESAGLLASPHQERLAWAIDDRSGTDAQMRWATPDFAAIDFIGNPPRLQLFDRRIDPGELDPRGAESEAIWDSLRTEMIHRALGESIELEVSATLGPEQTMQFAVDAIPDAVEIVSGPMPRVLPYAGGTLLRCESSVSGQLSLRLRVPSESAVLRMRPEWLGTDSVALGQTLHHLPAQSLLRVVPNDPSFIEMLAGLRPNAARVSLRWDVNGWWTQP